MSSYIVVLKRATPPGTKLAGASHETRSSTKSVEEICDCLCQEFKMDVQSSYKHVISGFAADMTCEEATLLAQHPEVAEVHKDVRLYLFKPIAPVSESSTPSSTPGVGKLPGMPSIVVMETMSTSDKVTVPWGVAEIRPSLVRLATGDLPQIKDIEVDVDVYVLDTGVDPSHPDLNVVESVSMIRDPISAAQPLHGHGTHVAGTIGAGNGRGAPSVPSVSSLLGVAPRARIHSVRVLDGDGSGMLSWILGGIDFVAKRKMSLTAAAGGAAPVPIVANMSLGMESSSKAPTLIDRAVDDAASLGVVFCVAAGNSTIDADYSSPAHSSRVITVSAHDSKGRSCYFSNFGRSIDVSAPGDDILSTWPTDASRGVSRGKATTPSYAKLSGTSMATPHITGIVALYLSLNPSATVADVLAWIGRLRNKAIRGVAKNTVSQGIILVTDLRFAGSFSSKGTTTEGTPILSKTAGVGSTVTPSVQYFKVKTV